MPRLTSLLILLCVGLMRSGATVANPVYPDEDSLSNGAQLYELYCSECHGIDVTSTYSPRYEPPASTANAYVQLIEEEQRKQAEKEAAQQAQLASEKAPWPEWAERPDPDAELPPDPRMETVAELNALIDEAHGIKPDEDADTKSETAPGKEPVTSAVGGFEPIPGATNLADPTTYFYGTSEQEMFDNIANGTGTIMVGWRSELGSDNAIWDVVNYLRSFWGEEWQE